MSVPKIEPIKVTEYETKQSKYPHCGRLPIRSIVLGPSGSGKTVLLTNLILDVYKGCFSRIYIFSPSIDVDATWKPVKIILRNMICVVMKSNVFSITIIQKTWRRLLKHREK